MSQPDLQSDMDEFKKYFEMQKQYSNARDSERELTKRREQESRMQEQLKQWQDAVEQLAKVEALLAGYVSQEMQHRGHVGGVQLAWASRLDQIIGELSRYRDTLMRRVADGLLPRLTSVASLKKPAVSLNDLTQLFPSV